MSVECCTYFGVLPVGAVFVAVKGTDSLQVLAREAVVLPALFAACYTHSHVPTARRWVQLGPVRLHAM
jgi:hypothetical protein